MCSVVEDVFTFLGHTALYSTSHSKHDWQGNAFTGLLAAVLLTPPTDTDNCYLLCLFCSLIYR